MQQGIVAHDCYIDETNVDPLREMGFVFICIDKGKVKWMIVGHLENGVNPSSMLGREFNLVDNTLLGIQTVTTSIPPQARPCGVGLRSVTEKLRTSIPGTFRSLTSMP